MNTTIAIGVLGLTLVTGVANAQTPGEQARILRDFEHRVAAYVDGVTPAPITTSSHACSLSRRKRAQATQKSGLNQKIARTASAATCTAQSARRMCASSCARTMAMRASLHPSASMGSPSWSLPGPSP